MKKRVIAMVLAGMLLTGAAGCGNKAAGTNETKGETETAASSEAVSSEAADSEAAGDDLGETEIQAFIAASLSKVMQDVADQFGEEHPDVKITFNADSSGKLMTQIEEGYNCDLFFSAAQKQMNQLEEDGLLIDGTRADVVNNQVVVVTQKDSDTKVTGLENLNEAKNIALADGSVPVGKYTRQALVKLGILPEAEDVSKITTQEVSEALGGASISEQENVSKVLLAVVERSCEVGTTYYSDTYGYEDELTILEKVPYEQTGNVIYPIARVVNKDADDAENAAADAFLEFVLSDDAKKVFESYYFDTNVD